MRQVYYRVEENREIARGVYRMALSGDTSPITRPGQFVDLALDGLYLRRPISVCDWSEGALTLVYRVVGEGTARLSALGSGATLDALSGLGNGYDLGAIPEGAVLAGGGVGVPPLYALAKRLIRAGKRPLVCLGFNSAADAILREDFEALGEVRVATVDGSAGVKGYVTDLMPEGGYACACGPEPMLRAVYDRCRDGQFSFEARMGCGFGACMGCTCQTLTGYKRICKDGPVLRREELLWAK